MFGWFNRRDITFFTGGVLIGSALTIVTLIFPEIVVAMVKHGD